MLVIRHCESSFAAAAVPINPVPMTADTVSATAAIPPAMTPDEIAAALPAVADESGSLAPPREIQALSLKMRALIGSAWTMGDYVLSRGLALASNVILAWMLMPEEAFGLMATVSVFLMGLAMFSDIGIGPNIIFSKRGEDSEYLNTAWTIQVLRGGALFICSCILAWPVSLFYQAPPLAVLLPVCGFTAVIQGFTSTSLVMLNRRMRLGMITVLDMIGQILQILTMIAWAKFISLDVWSLVFGSYVSSGFRVLYSHLLVREHKTRFAWNKADARSMFHFGRWIFMSTVLTFLAGQLDRLMFAKMLGMAMMGIYNIAVQFSIVPQQLIKKMGSVVAFPVLAEVARERPEELPRQFRRVRTPLVVLSLSVIVTLILIAKPLIVLLYKGNYENAGPILQVLSVGALGGVLNTTYGSVLLAMKKTFEIMALLVTYIIFLIVGTQLGFHWYGEVGFIWGVALVEWLNYPFNAAVLARHGMWQARLDAAVIAVSAATIFLAFWVLP